MTNHRTIQPDAWKVIVGVDTHKHVHVAVAIDTWGIRLGDRSCAAVLAPMSSANVARAIAVKQGCLRRTRTACRRSRASVSIGRCSWSSPASSSVR